MFLTASFFVSSCPEEESESHGTEINKGKNIWYQMTNNCSVRRIREKLQDTVLCVQRGGEGGCQGE